MNFSVFYLLSEHQLISHAPIMLCHRHQRLNFKQHQLLFRAPTLFPRSSNLSSTPVIFPSTPAYLSAAPQISQHTSKFSEHQLISRAVKVSVVWEIIYSQRTSILSATPLLVSAAPAVFSAAPAIFSAVLRNTTPFPQLSATLQRSRPCWCAEVLRGGAESCGQQACVAENCGKHE